MTFFVVCQIEDEGVDEPFDFSEETKICELMRETINLAKESKRNEIAGAEVCVLLNGMDSSSHATLKLVRDSNDCEIPL